MIPYGRQEVTQADIDAVVAVLQSEYLTQGQKVPEFEREIAQYCGAKHAVATNSATSALHLACLALDLEPGDWVWTSPITFVASANCALYCGAKVDFVDIDPKTYNLSPHLLEQKLKTAEIEGRLPKIIIPVHLCGQSCDMEAIHRLSKQYKFKIIEDAAHAIGGKYKSRPIGCGQYSDITIFSFHPVKIITSAEGGMALTNDPLLAKSMALLRSHGITRDPDQMTHEPDGPWYYQQRSLGYNYRMSDLHAALGLSQLKRLDAYVRRRHELAERYNEMLSDLPIITPWQHPDCYSSRHLYVIQLDLTQIDCSHRAVFEAMRAHGVGVNIHYIPVHTQPFFEKMGFAEGDFPQAEQYYSVSMSLPIYPTLTDFEQEKVVSALHQAMK